MKGVTGKGGGEGKGKISGKEGKRRRKASEK